MHSVPAHYSSQANCYLASKSPRRQDLLRQIGVEFGVIAVDVPEVQASGETPDVYVQRLAQRKALAGLEGNADRPVIGADTIGVLAGKVLEKPNSRDDAIEMLLSLSGQTHQVMTAVTVAFQDRLETCLNATTVSFRAISSAEAKCYWQTGEGKDKSGAYAIQGFAAVFVSHIEGSYSSVMGLPLFETAQLLESFSVPVWQF